MEIQYGKQIYLDELKGKPIDLFILAENHEKRVLSAFTKLNEDHLIKRTIVFCYEDFIVEKHSKREKRRITTHEQIFGLLDEHFNQNGANDQTIVIDYSCMTKSWYYSIILYFAKKETQLTSITTIFIYTPAKFSFPQMPKYNSEIEPLPGKYIVPTNKPKALIVCLGYEQNKAEGIIEHLDPKVSFVYYTKPALDSEYVTALEKNNMNILNDTQKNITTFAFNDLLSLERKLTSLYYSLRDQYSIIIAPLGPKPFTFISMLMSVKYHDIDIWRVGSGSDINKYDSKPMPNQFITSQISWIANKL